MNVSVNKRPVTGSDQLAGGGAGPGGRQPLRWSCTLSRLARWSLESPG